MSDAIDYKGYTITLQPDDLDQSPREWDNACTMVCWHNRYNLGDKASNDYNPSIYNSREDLENALKQDYGSDCIMRPLYLYDHSGLRIKIGSFQGLLPQGHAEFDSGQVGYIIISKKKAIEEFGKKIFTKKVLEKTLTYMEGVVRTYDQFLSGDVWHYTIEKDEKYIISVGGCYGYEDTLNLAREEIDCEIKNRLV